MQNCHLIFYDGSCQLCISSVSKILKIDRKKIFLFAPLNGESAKKELKGMRVSNTMILIEYPKKRVWMRGRAVFRIFWLLGGKWRLVGWLCFMPFVDMFYRVIAHHRHRLSLKYTKIPSGYEERFLS